VCDLLFGDIIKLLALRNNTESRFIDENIVLKGFSAGESHFILQDTRGWWKV
jgi:hypothetical protein